MKARVEFKAYGRMGNLMGHTWVVRGTHSETMEREMYQKLLREGHYFRVEEIKEVAIPL